MASTRRSLGLVLIVLLELAQLSVSNRTVARSSRWNEGQQDGQDNEDGDIQVSTCRITSQQLASTAQAAAARALKGICNPAEIEDRFHNLETQLGDQLNVLKAMLLSLEDKIVEQDLELKRNHRRMMSVLAGVRRSEGTGSTVIDDTNTYRPAYVPVIPHRAQEVVDDDEDDIDTDDEEDDGQPLHGLQYGLQIGRERSTGTSSGSGGGGAGGAGGARGRLNENFGGDTKTLKSGQVGPRSSEIQTFNSTVHVENGKRVFTYYWIVTGMSYKLRNWNQQRVLRSHSFYVSPGGYRMYMKMVPKYSATNMFLHVGITKGTHDQQLEWPFGLKMRVHILDQDDSTTRAQDLKSRLWDPKELCSGSNWVKPVVADNPECVGLGIPHDVIRTRNYVWNDRMIVKLNVYLN